MVNPVVPARSMSAWSPLLKSKLNDIGSIIDRWRSNLDVVLVFVSGYLNTVEI